MNCSPTIDFTTALAQLLCDGAQRDLFRVNAINAAQRLNVQAEDRAAFIALSPKELEAQAEVLLHKRLDQVKHFAPELCEALGADLWPHFRAWARTCWPNDARQDASGFCAHVSLACPAIVSRAEQNRIHFFAGAARIRIRFIRHLKFADNIKPGVQVLWRNRRGRVREMRLFLGF